MAEKHVVLNHLGTCPERDGAEVRVKIVLRELDAQARILRKRAYRRRDYTPPQFLKERYECPYSGECAAVRENPDVCPVYQLFSYTAYVE
ncbi:MAG: hypothetical protein IJT94_07590 [Oscillibacter sp.]|nr:hypothetical protein [Oscillibacter sp.]